MPSTSGCAPGTSRSASPTATRDPRRSCQRPTTGTSRLRDEGYTDADLDEWARVIREHEAGWEDTYVYFKHEDEGKGPELARQLMDRLGL